MLNKCSGQISVESVDSTYPINSFKDKVFLWKTIASFRHSKICKPVTPSPEMYVNNNNKTARPLSFL